MEKEAEEMKDEDEKQKALINWRNKGETIISSTEQYLEDLKDKLTEKTIKEVKKEIKKVKPLLETCEDPEKL